MSELSLEHATAETFEPHEGTDFMLDLDDDAGELTIRLAQVLRLASQPHAPRAEPFSLLFVGPASPVLPQRIYRIAHPVVGSMELFLVPLGPEPGGAGGMRYEAAFN